MRSTRVLRLLIGLLLLLSVVVAPQVGASNPGQGANNSGPPTGIENSIIAVFHPWVADPSEAANDIARQHGADVQSVYQHAIKGFAAQVPGESIARIERDPRIAHVEADQFVNTFGDIPTGVDRIETDKKLDIGGSEPVSYSGHIDIAIIDTGIDHRHGALNVVGGTDCTGGAPCSNGYPGDGHGHGTHVAGTAAGIDGSGAVGVAPGADLWAIKVLDDSGSGSMSNVIAGIDWVTERANTIDVANMSLGCECTSFALDTALTNSTDAGIIYVVAAGNSNANAATFSPAKHPNVITVSALADFDGMEGGVAKPTCRNDEDDTYANFSNYGDVVDIMAPGVCIKSTVPGGGYAISSGTSMASPHVAGAAALYITEHPGSSWSQVRDGLTGNNWSVAQDDECGLVNSNHGKSNEPFLLLAYCGTETGDEDEQAVTGTITGTVADSVAGSAIDGAFVSIDGTDLNATSGSDGSYTIVEIPEGTYNVTALADGFEPETKTTAIEQDGQVVGIDFALSPEPASAISGTVSDSVNSGGITGATVSIDGTDLSATSGSDGSYTIEDIPEGTYNVTALADGFESETIQGVEVAGSESTTANFSLTPVAEDEDDADAEIGNPVIHEWSIATRVTGPWKRADVVWTVSHPDGALVEVKTELLAGTTAVDSQTSSVSGGSASGEHELRTRSNADKVRITVTDTDGNIVTESESVFQ